VSDLTTQEQTNVRAALRYLRARCGTWDALAKALRFKLSSLAHVSGGKTVSARLMLRVARLADISVDDLLAGRYPPAGTCPHCGRPSSDFVDEETIAERTEPTASAR
jgi:hypothetical protein